MGQLYARNAIGASASGGSTSTGPYIPETWDAPGATAMLYYAYASNALPHYAGEELPGSRFSDGGVVQPKSTTGAELMNGQNIPSGTWRLQGVVQSGDAYESVTQAMRVDAVTQTQLTDSRFAELVRNLTYANADGTLIDCELFYQNAWHPFTASPNDSAWWGPEIYAAAVAGELGDIAAYTIPSVPDDSGDATAG